MTPPKIIIIGRGGCDAQKTCGTTTSVASTTTPLLDDQQNDVVIDFREERLRQPSQKIVVWTVLALLSLSALSFEAGYNITTTGARVDQHQHQQQRLSLPPLLPKWASNVMASVRWKERKDDVDDDAHGKTDPLQTLSLIHI